MRRLRIFATYAVWTIGILMILTIIVFWIVGLWRAGW